MKKKASKSPKKVLKAHKINIPNILTLGRIWAIPLIVLTMYFIPRSSVMAWISVVLFALAGLTDYFDGYFARHLDQGSRFGRILDPIADKLLVGAVLVMLVFTDRIDGLMIIPALIILCREFLVSGLREFLAEIKVGLPVTKLAKWKTTFQMVALPVLMVADVCPLFRWVGQIGLCFAALMTVITGYDYWRSGSKYMNDEK